MTKPKMYKYTAFGLVIDSEVCLPELENSAGEAEISIIKGTVPFNKESADLNGNNYNYIMSRDKFSFLIEHIAKYSIENGSLIVIEPFKGADSQTIRAYLLGMGLGILLIQKGLIPIHGSAITVEGKAVIFTGNSGAGKTTLCSWFQKHGYGYLADDISAIKLDNSLIPIVQPGYSQQKVCEDTADHLNMNTVELSLASMHDDKFILDNKKFFVSQPVPLKAIVEIAETGNSRLTIQKVAGIEKIHYFMKNIYSAGFYREIGFDNSFFENSLQIVKRIEFYQLQRPSGTFSAEEQMQLVIKTIFS